MNKITLEILRQELQNCGKALMASDFRDLLDWLTDFADSAGTGALDSDKPVIDDPGYNPRLNEDNDYGWHFILKEGTYTNFKDMNNNPIVVSSDDLYYNGNITIFKWDSIGKYWVKIVIKSSDLNSNDIVHTLGDNKDKVISQDASTNLFLRKDGSNPITPIGNQYQEMLGGDYDKASPNSLVTKIMLKQAVGVSPEGTFRQGEGIIFTDDDSGATLINVNLGAGSLPDIYIISRVIRYDNNDSNPTVIDLNGSTLNLDKGYKLEYSGQFKYVMNSGDIQPTSCSGDFGTTLPPDNTLSNVLSQNIINTKILTVNLEGLSSGLRVNDNNDVYLASNDLIMAFKRDVINFLSRRYTCYSNTPILTQLIIQSGVSELSNSKVKTTGSVQTTTALPYFSYCYDSTLGELSELVLGGAEAIPILQVCNKTVINVANASGLTVSLNCYTNKDANAFADGYTNLIYR